MGEEMCLKCNEDCVWLDPARNWKLCKGCYTRMNYTICKQEDCSCGFYSNETSEMWKQHLRKFFK